MTLDDADPDPDPDLAFAGALAQRVIDRFGKDAPPLRVEHVRYYHGFETGRWEMEFSDEPADDIRIAVRTDTPTGGAVSANLSLLADRADAVVATATHIQDYVLEQTHGEPLPPCPGHQHPLQASVVEGVASWVCPQDREHHVEPIVPDPAG